MTGIKMRCAICTFAVLICATLCAQDIRVKPQFEVASVRPVSKDQVDDLDPRFAKVFRELRLDLSQKDKIPMAGPDRVHIRNWSLRDLIAAAYSVHASQISGPAWLSDKSFNIEARVPENTPKGELNAMLQSLLEERFALRLHRITQTKHGYAITVGKGGPKLTPAELPSASSQKLSQKESQLIQELNADNKRIKNYIGEEKPVGSFTSRSWRSITIEELAHHLEGFTEAPVVDETGLTGRYSVTIEIAQNPGGLGGTIFDAVEKLGLKLEPRKVPVDILVVDQVNQVPTAN
jgi:uncharacterized protein (TIGR03435 family)